VTAFSLSTVGSLEGKSCITFSADFLITIELFGNGSDSWVHDTTSESED
jgi:hypothetical protein